MYVGIYWNNHHHLLHALTHVNGAVLWANLHPATPTVIALFTALTLVAVVRRERGRVLAFATAAAAVALATGLNPYGYRVIAQGLSLSREASRYVFEWRHADPTDPWQVVFVIAAVPWISTVAL